MNDTPEERIATVHRELAELKARDEARTASQLAPRRRRRVTGPSIVFSIRLDPEEYAALEARSAVTNVKPSVLARSLVRSGLAARSGAAIASAVDRLEAAVEELRALDPLTFRTLEPRADRCPSPAR